MHELPIVKEVKLPSLTLPTAWQTVIFRNYGYVRTACIARVLGCDTKTVCNEAHRLGLSDTDYCEEFKKRGYITIIRNNWYLLPYAQLLELLDLSEEELAFVLKNDDFLDVKLGGFKPLCKEVRYTPLTEEQCSLSAAISQTVCAYSKADAIAPFDFFANEDLPMTCAHATGKRIVHGYLSPCGDAFLTDCTDTLPDTLLEKYQRVGVNGIWLHATLATLSPYPFAPALSRDYELRRKNLNKIIKRCAGYGISLYLYLNEPRALPVDALPCYEPLIGWKKRRTLCLAHREVRDYLYGAVRDLCAAAKDLGGIFTITMSENPTHCSYSKRTECPTCATIPPEQNAAEVNNIIHRAMRDGGCKGELIANLWGWSPFLGWSDAQIRHGIGLLDKEIGVMCTSEYDLDIQKGGIRGKVIDYSISNPGPSAITKGIFSDARSLGHTLYAKIQASNSWECSAVPYIPVFDLVYEHLRNLDALDVKDHFLTWTLGGYPSPSIEIAARYDKHFDLDAWYLERFGAQAEAVHRAIRLLCDAFREYPFSLNALYNAPKNLGPANLWDTEPEEKRSTMVCYSFDDFENWTLPYPYEIYVSQLKRLLSKWEQGLAALTALPGSAFLNEIIRYATVCLCHFKADLLQTEFAYYKRNKDRNGMRKCVITERENAVLLLDAMQDDAKIGYEASNHYAYTERNLIEKILRMDAFEKLLDADR